MQDKVQKHSRRPGVCALTRGSANSADGASTLVVLQVEQKVVEFFPFESLLVCRGEYFSDFPVG